MDLEIIILSEVSERKHHMLSLYVESKKRIQIFICKKRKKKENVIYTWGWSMEIDLDRAEILELSAICIYFKAAF